MVSYLIFKSFSHFEFIFVCGMRECSNFIDLHAAIWLYPHYLLKRLSFSFVHPCPLCQTLVSYSCVSLFLSSLFYSIDLCLFLCQYHAALITVALQYCLKSGRVIPPTLFFFLRVDCFDNFGFFYGFI